MGKERQEGVGEREEPRTRRSTAHGALLKCRTGEVESANPPKNLRPTFANGLSSKPTEATAGIQFEWQFQLEQDVSMRVTGGSKVRIGGPMNPSKQSTCEDGFDRHCAGRPTSFVARKEHAGRRSPARWS